MACVVGHAAANVTATTTVIAGRSATPEERAHARTDMLHITTRACRRMTDDEIVAMLRTRVSPALRLIGGRIAGYEQARQQATLSFEATEQMCHSQVIVQGGFITAMVDSAMAFAAMGCYAERVAVPTLEIKVNFLEAGNPGPMHATARVVRLGRTVGFLEAWLHQRDRLIATATSTIRIIPARS